MLLYALIKKGGDIIKKLCFYNGRVYNIIYNFKYNEFDFSICSDEQKLVYFKRDMVNDKYAYIPYDRWIKAFKKEELNKDAKKINKFIDDLSKDNNYDVSYIKKRVDKFLNPKSNSKQIKRKFLNQYFLIFMISAISLAFGGFTLFNWYNEGRQVDNIMADVLKNTKIEETVAFTSTEIPKITEEINSESDAGHKYGEDYWKYMQMTMIRVELDEL